MTNRAAEARDLVDAVVRFCRFLKLWGTRIHPDASQAALLALREIDLGNRQDFRTALRMAIIHRPEDFPLYDHLFNAFWGDGIRGSEAGRASDAFPNRPVDAKRVGEDRTGSGTRRGRATTRHETITGPLGPTSSRGGIGAGCRNRARRAGRHRAGRVGGPESDTGRSGRAGSPGSRLGPRARNAALAAMDSRRARPLDRSARCPAGQPSIWRGPGRAAPTQPPSHSHSAHPFLRREPVDGSACRILPSVLRCRAAALVEGGSISVRVRHRSGYAPLAPGDLVEPQAPRPRLRRWHPDRRMSRALLGKLRELAVERTTPS